MNWTTFFQKFGAMEARSQQAAKDAAEIKTELRDVKTTVSELKSFQDRLRGVWIAIAVVSAVIGAIAGIVARYFGGRT